MKFVSILHYVEMSYGGKPSFVILMSDGKEYISNGCVFVENNQENIDQLIQKYSCKSFLDELFDSPPLPIEELVDGRSMFRGCKSLTEFNIDLPNLVNGQGMFFCCKSLTDFNSDLPNLVDGSYMFCGCDSLTEFNVDLPNLEDDRAMFF